MGVSAAEELGQVGHHDVRPMGPQLLGLIGPVNADHVPEVAGPARVNPGESIFEHRGLGRFSAEQASTDEVGVRGRLSP